MRRWASRDLGNAVVVALALIVSVTAPALRVAPAAGVGQSGS